MATIAIVSDIHANIVALETVLADLDRIQPDRIVYLGDAAATGPAPKAVLDRLQTLDWAFVRGNCDDALLRNAAGPTGEPTDEHDEIDRWCASQATPADLSFVATFAPVVRFDTGGVTFCCYHGSPRSNLDEILPTTADTDLDAFYADHPAKVYAGGHTHLQMVRRHRDGFAINPGSTGLPFTYLADDREVNPLWAEYALVRVNAGAIGIELKRTPIDRERLLKSARQSEMPCKAWWMRDWA